MTDPCVSPAPLFIDRRGNELTRVAGLYDRDSSRAYRSSS